MNPGQFIQKFNAASAHLKGKVIGVLVTVYKDRTFDFELKSPPASVLLKDAVKAEKGSGERARSVTDSQNWFTRSRNAVRRRGRGAG